MDKAEKILDPEARYEAWGKLDQQVVETAGAVPWLWENYPTLFSSRVVPALQVDNSGGPDVGLHVGEVAPWRSGSKRTSPPGPPAPGGGALGAVSGAAGALFGSSMLRYVARRVLWGVFLLLVVSAITFLIFYASPRPTRRRCARAGRRPRS